MFLWREEYRTNYGKCIKFTTLRSDGLVKDYYKKIDKCGNVKCIESVVHDTDDYGAIKIYEIKRNGKTKVWQY